MKMFNVHLLCNAHLDPVYLWEIEEGIGETISTFRIAADFCEKNENFIFNHNEAILYEWVKKYDQPLYLRIKKLVEKGRWHIMGGWYLQPDCNMPSGEAVIRQIGRGRSFFLKEFGRIPTTAINFDPFGHSRGLVAIMKAFGFDSYIITRPSEEFLEVPDSCFTWIGFDGSEVQVLRRKEYKTQPGCAAADISEVIRQESGKKTTAALWGIGNHGGGPSKQDFADIENLAFAMRDKAQFHHSTPEKIFKELRKYETFPSVKRDLNPWGPGCYTSQIRIKQLYRKLENMLFWTEAASVHAEAAEIQEYPSGKLDEAERILLTTQFHDILPGTSIQKAEESSIRMLQYAVEILSEIRRDIFIAFALKYFKNPEEGIPILVYNPFPHAFTTDIDCEFQPAHQNREPVRTTYIIKDSKGRILPSQIEKEASNINLDWRKRIIFRASIPAGSMSIFVCTPLKTVPIDTLQQKKQPEHLNIDNPELSVEFDSKKGLPTKIYFAERIVCDQLFGELTVFNDNPDPWGSQIRGYNTIIGRYKCSALNCIEKGEVRTVVQSTFIYKNSTAVMEWSIPSEGCYIDLSIEVNHQNPDSMLKLSIPIKGQNPIHRGQTMFGAHTFEQNCEEKVSQRWQSVETSDGMMTAVLDDGIYGSHLQGSYLYLSLLHTPCYSAYPIENRFTESENRVLSRIDTGKRFFTFRFIFSEAAKLSEKLEYESLKFSAAAYSLAIFPGAQNPEPFPEGLKVSGTALIVSALKRSACSLEFILRLFNPHELPERAVLSWSELNIEHEISVKGRSFSTFRIKRDGSIKEVPVTHEYLSYN